MSKLEKVYLTLKSLDKRRTGEKYSPAIPLVTLIYLIAVLSVPILRPQQLIWLSAYPIITSEMVGVGYGKIFLKSLWILPFLILIGIFNPLIERTPVFAVYNIEISRGWVSFISIIFRGLLSLQAVLVMISSIGFLDIFAIMRKTGMPKVLCQQLLLTYRNLSLIMEEAILMKRAREARGFGKKTYPLKMWGVFIGQLLIRSSERAIRIHRAMLARGFTGTLPLGRTEGWNSLAFIWLLIWTIVIILLRFVDFSKIITHFIT